MKKKPEYKDKEFKNEKEFQLWLEGIIKYTVFVKDMGDEVVKIYIDKGGEILHIESDMFPEIKSKIVEPLSIDIGKKMSFDCGAVFDHKTIHVIKKTVKRKDPNLGPCPKCRTQMVKTASNFQTCPKGDTGLEAYTSPWARG